VPPARLCRFGPYARASSGQRTFSAHVSVLTMTSGSVTVYPCTFGDSFSGESTDCVGGTLLTTPVLEPGLALRGLGLLGLGLTRRKAHGISEGGGVTP